MCMYMMRAYTYVHANKGFEFLTTGVKNIGVLSLPLIIIQQYI